MENNLMINQQPQISLIDTLDIGTVQSDMQKIVSFQALIQRNLKENHDYGVIAGAGSKPTLLKPGGEKICMIFGLNQEYEFLKETENYKDGFFAYNIKCTLLKNGKPVSQGVGSCNSMEKKYRFINSDVIPEGTDPTLVEKITDKYGREKYKIPNPHIADLVNTILKMAKKRAFIDAVLQVASLSDIFTQDLEDIKEYVQAEQTENMTMDMAKKLKINFGTYKGKSLEEVFSIKPDYINWLFKNAKDEIIRKASKLILDEDLDNNKAKHNSKNRKQEAEPEQIGYEGTPFEGK